MARQGVSQDETPGPGAAETAEPHPFRRAVRQVRFPLTIPPNYGAAAPGAFHWTQDRCLTCMQYRPPGYLPMRAPLSSALRCEHCDLIGRLHRLILVLDPQNPLVRATMRVLEGLEISLAIESRGLQNLRWYEIDGRAPPQHRPPEEETRAGLRWVFPNDRVFMESATPSEVESHLQRQGPEHAVSYESAMPPEADSMPNTAGSLNTVLRAGTQ